MVIARRMEPATFERLAVYAEYLRAELWDGVLVEKPVMSPRHGDVVVELAFALQSQIERARARVRIDHAKLAILGGNYVIPDLALIPTSALTNPDDADLYHGPVLFVAEVWSPTTGGYDSADNVPGYMARGDAEIWRIHPVERTVTRWVREPDGEYAESVVTGGRIVLAALPEVEIDTAQIVRE